MSLRSRNIFVLLVVVGLLAASGVVIASKETRLGLDLQGGVELVYEAKGTPQVPNPDAAALDRSVEIVRKRVDALGVSEPEIARVGTDQLIVSLPGVPDAQRAEQQVGTTAQMHFYDWEANVLDENCQPATTPGSDAAAQQSIAGKEEAVKRAVKCGKNVEPDRNDTTRSSTFYAFAANGEELATGDSRQDLVDSLRNEKLPPGANVYEVPRGRLVVRAPVPDDASDEQKANWDRWFVIEDDPELSGTDIKSPEQNYDQRTNEPIVTMEYTSEGRKAFHEVTRRLAQRGQEQPSSLGQGRLQHFAIVLDNEIVSLPTIDFRENPDGIDGSTGSQISGGFTVQSAQDLAEFLKIGALPVTLDLVSRSQVSATLGQQALDQGLVAGLVGLGVVALFLITFYRVLGLIAVGALMIYAVYFFTLAKLIPITLTLPGIAGAVLTIGVAADANIVIFERIKEEVRDGRSIPAGIAAGYKKGFATIIDANAVIILVAFILFMLATAGVKGFALTLGVGTLVSLFTAVLATQAILLSMRNSRLITRPSALGAGKPKRRISFDFMGASKWFFSMSGLILLVAALAIGGKGMDFGIEFESGTRIKTPLQQPFDVQDLRSQLTSEVGLESPKVQALDDPDLGEHVVQMTVKELPPGGVSEVRQFLADRYGVDDANFSQDSIGPTFGESIARSAAMAVVASLLVIALYIGLRFEWKFAVPVLIALMHDVLITAGVYSLVDREVTTATVAALLTILGYSLYDTIIVFDRIRENAPRMPNATFSQIVNRSMSEVIVRSIATTISTVLPVLALFVFGGDTLKDFAFALIVGALSGTYSSVFIAGPVLCHWKEREKLYQARERRVRAAFEGIVPAYAVAAAGVGPIDVAPAERKKRRRTGLADQPDQVSKEEFDDMVRELHVDEPASGEVPSGGRGGAGAPAAAQPDATVKRTGRRAQRRAARAAGEPLPQPGVDPSEQEQSPPQPGAGDGARSPNGGDDGGAGSGGETAQGSPSGSSKPPGGRRQKKRRHGRPR